LPPLSVGSPSIATICRCVGLNLRNDGVDHAQHDLDVIKAGSTSQRRNAAIVRAGEKRVLNVAARAVLKAVADGVPGGKRKSENPDPAGEKIKRTKGLQDRQT
jgi:hypothetical protein